MKYQTFSWIKAAHRTAAIGLIAATAAAASAGCGGIGPGDYIMYRVAVSTSKPGKDCDVSENIKSDSSTFKASNTFYLYAGAEDAYFLDTGEVTLEGAEEDDGYKFSGKTVDVEFLGGAQTDKVTQTTAVTIEMVVDGAAVSGKITSKASLTYACTGPCPTNESCTQTSTFVGTEVEDVDLEHDPG